MHEGLASREEVSKILISWLQQVEVFWTALGFPTQVVLSRDPSVAAAVFQGVAWDTGVGTRG